MRIGIVGAGMAGLACAGILTGLGHEVLMFDKGQRPGGRMSTRRIATPAGDAFFDYGAQYFTAREGAFQQRVAAWVSEGVAARWPAAGRDAFAGVPGMNALVEQMAKGQIVRWATRIAGIECHGHGWRLACDDGETLDADAVIVATPAEQASVLLAEVAPDLAARARAVPSEPCWTLMLAFLETVAVATDCWRGDGVIGWAARNNSKPGRHGQESWVVQAGPTWSKAHLEADRNWVAAALKSELSGLLDVELPGCAGEAVHRWRYAKSGADGAGAIYDENRRLGICGDWLIGPRVEAAWLSGTMLANQIGL